MEPCLALIRHAGHGARGCRPRACLAPRAAAQTAGRPDGGPRRRGSRRSPVEPLGVVDRHEQRSLRGEHSQERRRGNRQRALVRQLPGRRGPQEGDLDRMPLDGGQHREIRVRDLGEQVRQAAEREPALRFGGSGAQDPDPVSPCTFDGGAPDRGLPDPGLAVDDEACQTGAPVLEEPLDGLQLGRSADHVGRDGARSAEWPRDPELAHPPSLWAPRGNAVLCRRNVVVQVERVVGAPWWTMRSMRSGAPDRDEERRHRDAVRRGRSDELAPAASSWPA